MAAPTREEAWELFCHWTESDSLRRHVLGVEAAMRAYARKYGEDEELWAATGILHDLDYERHPDPRAATRGWRWSCSSSAGTRRS
ncbi:MAG: HD domain-containing protein [Solirubrobacterales bacterium]